MTDQCPFEIRLQVETPLGRGSGTSLHAVLVNRSRTVQKVLAHETLQPSVLELIRPDGSAVASFDDRSNRKYDATVRCDDFRAVAAGGEVSLGSVKFKRSGDGFAGAWGPFEFEGVPAGDYQACVVWVSTAASCLDEATGQVRSPGNVWLGRVESARVALRLR